MTTATNNHKNVFSYSERVAIAAVLTWDCLESHVYSPDEIEDYAIQVDIVSFKLTDNRTYIIPLATFRTILEAQKAAANKIIEEVIEAEEAQVIEAERETAELIAQAVVEPKEQPQQSISWSLTANRLASKKPRTWVSAAKTQKRKQSV